MKQRPTRAGQISGRNPGKSNHSAGLKLFASRSAWSAGSPSLGWLPAVRFIPGEGDPADEALEGHDRLESGNPCATRTYSACNIKSELVRLTDDK